MKTDDQTAARLGETGDLREQGQLRWESCAELAVTVNGEPVTRLVEVRKSLADFLREDLGLTGTHLGCEHGVCGACTVLVDGRSVRSCLTLAMQAQGSCVTTIEGLSDQAIGQEVQSALASHGGLQCGYCTPGFVATIVEIINELREAPEAAADLDEAGIRSRLSGNLCRCTGYEGIVDATADLCRRLTEPRDL